MVYLCCTHVACENLCHRSVHSSFELIQVFLMVPLPSLSFPAHKTQSNDWQTMGILALLSSHLHLHCCHQSFSSCFSFHFFLHSAPATPHRVPLLPHVTSPHYTCHVSVVPATATLHHLTGPCCISLPPHITSPCCTTSHPLAALHH